MTLQEYKDKLQEIKNEATKKEQSLAIEYAKANNHHKVGDIVTDHIGSIEVEKISYTITISKIPCAIYTGSELKKDCTKKKNNSVRSIYQTNLR